MQYNYKKTPFRMSKLKTSYIPSTFFGGQYFKVGKTVSNLHAVETRLKKIPTMLLLTVVNCFCMGCLKLPVSNSLRGSYLNNTCTLPMVGTGLTSAFSSSEQQAFYSVFALPKIPVRREHYERISYYLQ